MERVPQPCRLCGRTIYFDGICVDCRAEEKRNEILQWTQEKIEEKIIQICAAIEKTGELDTDAKDLFIKLVNYRDIDTSNIAVAAFHKNIFWPKEIYKNAPESIIKSMLETLQRDDTGSKLAGELLLCLAVYGGKDVWNVFLELEKNPREWRKKLYVNPSFYSTYGGWTYDESGRYIKTQYDKCYPMVKGTLAEKENSPVKIGVKTHDMCKVCGCQMVNLIELDGRERRLDFLGIDGVVKAKCCPNCCTFSDGTFCRYTLDGQVELIDHGQQSHEENYLKTAEIETLVSNTFVLGNAPVSPRYAADWRGGSSIGGYGFWIQDCEISACPDCGKPMKYLAQIQWDTVLGGMEGNAYIEICTDCKVVAILHQQT